MQAWPDLDLAFGTLTVFEFDMVRQVCFLKYITGVLDTFSARSLQRPCSYDFERRKKDVPKCNHFHMTNLSQYNVGTFGFVVSILFSTGTSALASRPHNASTASQSGGQGACALCW